MRAGALLLASLVCGCTQPLPVAHFAGPGPQFDPIGFFTGHVRSWGVLENRSGEPTGRVETDCVGTVEADGSLDMQQRLTFGDGSSQQREWRMRRTAPGQFEVTANDVVGIGHGEAAGRAFHLRWVLATEPGVPLRNVLLNQWMYLMGDGALVNRTLVSKLGVTLAEVTEQFERAP